MRTTKKFESSRTFLNAIEGYGNSLIYALATTLLGSSEHHCQITHTAHSSNHALMIEYKRVLKVKTRYIICIVNDLGTGTLKKRASNETNRESQFITTIIYIE